MRTASISEAKNNLSALLDQVRQGQTILITDRDRPVARLTPLQSVGQKDAAGRMERLEREGLVRRGHGKLDVEALLRSPLPRTRDGSSVLEALLEERREGR